MSAKTLPIQHITNELEGASLYFPKPSPSKGSSTELTPTSGNPTHLENDPPHAKLSPLAGMLESRQASKTASLSASRQASLPASTPESRREGLQTSGQGRVPDSAPTSPSAGSPESLPARVRATSLESKRAIHPASLPVHTDHDLIETVRKTIKQVGKEQLFVRLSPAEKDELREAAYAFNELYRGSGRKTSENEIARIALKFLLEDDRRNGEQSILALTQAALNA